MLRRPRQWFMGGMGASGAAWLHPPSHDGHILGNDELAVLLRRRLLCKDPAGTATLPCSLRKGQQNGKAGLQSQYVGDDCWFGTHAMACDHGPEVRDVWYEWLKSHLGPDRVQHEIDIQAWARRRPDGSMDRAVLDLVIQQRSRGTGFGCRDCRGQLCAVP